MALPSPTKIYHSTAYSAISTSRPELSVAGKVILITGAGSGIGPHLTSAFAVAGSRKLALVGRTLSTLQSTKASLEAEYLGIEVLALVADITDVAAVNRALAETKKKLGPIDVLISNAGYLPTVAPLATANTTEWARGYEVNVLGNLNLIQAFLANRVAIGSIFVNVSTVGVHIPAVPTMSGYAVSKLAALKLFEYMAAENPEVRVMNVHPGVMDTAMGVKGQEGGIVLPWDDMSLPSSFIVWAVSSEAAFLRGRLLWANWDVEELITRRVEFEGTPKFTMVLDGWPQ
ncbi:hypothetical protein MMC17_001767 [Xylographa soralifera]|nr:hypothetical protein [Xylographa soralifera]